MRRIGLALTSLGLLAALGLPAAAATKSTLRAELLPISSFPRHAPNTVGWSSANFLEQEQSDQGCLSGLKAADTSETRATELFLDGLDSGFGESLGTGPGVAARHAALNRALDRCKPFSVTANGGVKERVTINPVSPLETSEPASSYAMNVSLGGGGARWIQSYIVLFQVGATFGVVEYDSLSPGSSPNHASAVRYITDAVRRVGHSA
jgi:hypothetical protein